jgi:hypothetical protein
MTETLISTDQFAKDKIRKQILSDKTVIITIHFFFLRDILYAYFPHHMIIYKNHL